MIGRIKVLVLLLCTTINLLGQKQAFLTDRGEAHWLDSISAEYQNYRFAQSLEERFQAKSKAARLIIEVEESTADSAFKSVANFRGFNFWDKRRESKKYISVLKKINYWAPKDSVELRFFSNYQIGNAYIFLEDYDSAAFYLNLAFDIDIQNDLGKYEGSVQDRAALILYLLEDYEHSLQLSEISLRWATGRLRGAAYNQLGNTYNQLGNYLNAALAYDSASAYFEKEGISSTLPKFNSMSAYLEMGNKGEAKFLSIYDELVNNTSVTNYQAYVEGLELARAEFCLAYWEDSSRYEYKDLQDILMKPSPESIKFIRSALSKQLANTEGEWQTHREAFIVLKRFYILVRQDSVKYALERILDIDKAFIQELTGAKGKFGEAIIGSDSELKKLISTIGREELLRSDENSDRVEDNILRGVTRLLLYVTLLFICFYALRKTVISRSVTLANQEELNISTARRNKLIERMLPASWYNILDQQVSIEPNQQNDVIVIHIHLEGFTKSLRDLGNELFIQRLEELFSRLEGACAKYGLERFKTDGTSLVLVGGVNEDYVSPRQTLNAAKELHKSMKAFNHATQEFDDHLHLTIGIDIGSVDTGFFSDSGMIDDMLGEVFRRAIKLQSICPQGKIVMSQKVIDAEQHGIKWPKGESAEADSISARIFQ
jgi:class 3 adenylate cyclase/tetratricopeptide (TPR) repeat protein